MKRLPGEGPEQRPEGQRGRQHEGNGVMVGVTSRCFASVSGGELSWRQAVHQEAITARCWRCGCLLVAWWEGSEGAISKVARDPHLSPSPGLFLSRFF